MYLDEMTMSEFKEKVGPDTVLILPIGATEEHGSHLPLSTDSIQGEYIAERVAERTDAIIAPPIRYGICNSTKNFPGTVTLSFETFNRLIYEVLSEFVRHGIKNIVVLSGHAGRVHMSAIKVAAERVVNEEKVSIMVLSDYDIAYELLGKEFPEDDGHSGAVETSRILAINETLVRGSGEKTKVEFPRFMILRNPEKYFPTGVMGDPTLASKEKGEMINNYIVDELVRLIEEMRRINLSSAKLHQQ